MHVSPRLKPSIRSPIDIGFLIAGLALVIVGGSSLFSSQHLRTEAGWVSHTYQVLHILDEVENDIRLPVRDMFVTQRLAGELSQARALTSDNSRQQQRLDTLQASINGPRAKALGVVARLKTEEQRLLTVRNAATDKSAARTSVIILTSTVLALLLMGGALQLLHRDLRRRRLAERALQDSETKYRVLMEQAADAIFIVNSDAVCVEANARAAEILGRPEEQIRGLPLKAFVRRDGAATGPILPMLRYGHVTTGEFWVARADGSRIPVEIRATMLEDGRVQVIARDISERKEIERAKDEFVSIVSHELRTPLTSIRGALGLLAGGRLEATPEKRDRMIDLAASNTDRLIRLINDILDVERLNSGGVTFDREDVKVRDILEQSVDGLRTVADRAGVHLRWTADDLEIWADPDRMTQTLTNLVDNAIKFSEPSSTVDVNVRRDGQFAIFEVSDHGRGIPADKIDAVFKRFQQVDASDAREKGGTGLGLAICKSIVEQHGGRIWVESTVGDGSTFTFTIPLVEGRRLSTGDPGAPRVLVCDDDADLVEVLRATLMQRGFRVIGAQRGKTAIDLFDAEGADVAVVDILLPDISGIRLLRHIHASSPTTRIIVYTATYLDVAERDFIRGIGATIVTKARSTPEALADEVGRAVVPNATHAG